MTILERILGTKRDEVAAAKTQRPLSELRSRIHAIPPPRDFFGAVTAKSPGGIRLIAEIKRASPSAGLIVEDFDPLRIARIYAASGAAALSVLTDETYFQGRLSYIETVKQVVDLPVLRKDFIIEEYQVYESRAAGADAILVIAAAVPDVALQRRLCDTAHELGMSVLFEVHTEGELHSACAHFHDSNRRLILGINNRDLHAQRTDLATTERLASTLSRLFLNASSPPFVSESGIATREDVLRVQAAGACAILVGESLLKAPDIAARVRQLLGKP